MRGICDVVLTVPGYYEKAKSIRAIADDVPSTMQCRVANNAPVKLTRMATLRIRLRSKSGAKWRLALPVAVLESLSRTLIISWESMRQIPQLAGKTEDKVSTVVFGRSHTIAWSGCGFAVPLLAKGA